MPQELKKKRIPQIIAHPEADKAFLRLFGPDAKARAAPRYSKVAQEQENINKRLAALHIPRPTADEIAFAYRPTNENTGKDIHLGIVGKLKSEDLMKKKKKQL